MNVGKLTAGLGLDTREFEMAIRQAERRMEQSSRAMASSLHQVGEQMQRTGKQMQSAGKKMSLYLTTPIVGFGAMALRTAGNFEKSMNRVAAISQATESDIASLEKQARDLGSTTQFSASEAADAMSYLAMAGFEVKEVMEAMPSTLNLAAAGQMEMADAADIVSNVMQGFGRDASQTEQTVDTMAKAFTSANTNLHELGEAMSYAAPMAKTYGIELEETTAAIGFLSDAGIKGGRAGTGFRQVLAQLAKQADGLGLNIRDASGRLLPFADILEEVEKQGLTTAEMVEALGTRAGPAFAVLMDRGADALRDYTGELENAGGTAERVAEQQMEGLNGSLKELRSAFEELQIAIAQSGLLDWVTALTRRLTEFTRRLSETNPSLLRWGTILGSVVAAMGPLIFVSGTLIRSMGTLAKAGAVLHARMLPSLVRMLHATKLGFVKLNTVIAMNPIGALVTVLTAAASYLLIFRNRTSEAEEAQWKLGDAVKDTNAALGEQIYYTLADSYERMADGTLKAVGGIDNLANNIESLTREELESLRLYLEDEIPKAMRDLQNETNEVTRAIMSQDLAKYKDALGLVNGELEKFADNAESAGGAIDDNTKAVNENKTAWQELNEEIEKWNKTKAEAKTAEQLVEAEMMLDALKEQRDEHLTLARLQAKNPFGMDPTKMKRIETGTEAIVENTRDLSDNIQLVRGGFEEMEVVQAEFTQSMVDMSRIIEGALQGITSAFVDMAFGAKVSIQEVLKEMAKMIAMQLVSATISTAFGGGTGGVAGAVMSGGGFTPYPDVMKPLNLNVPGLASGGIAYDDTLVRVGEYAGVKSNPEVIAPLSDLSRIITSAMVDVGGRSAMPAMSGNFTTSKGFNDEIELVGRLEHDHIMLSNKRADVRRRLLE